MAPSKTYILTFVYVVIDIASRCAYLDWTRFANLSAAQRLQHKNKG